MYTWDADYSADGAPENSRVVLCHSTHFAHLLSQAREIASIS